MQGKFLTRQRLPTGDGDRVVNWKDLNTAIDLVVYGKKIRLYECDGFTREYLTSEGIEVNPNELPPSDFYIQSRRGPNRTFITPRNVVKISDSLKSDRPG